MGANVAIKSALLEACNKVSWYEITYFWFHIVMSASGLGCWFVDAALEDGDRDRDRDSIDGDDDILDISSSSRSFVHLRYAICNSPLIMAAHFSETLFYSKKPFFNVSSRNSTSCTLLQ